MANTRNTFDKMIDGMGAPQRVSPETVSETIDQPENIISDAKYYNTGGPLSFPKTLTTEWNHIIHFQRYEYSRSDAKQTGKESRSGPQIALPIPLDLQANYSASWENAELGLLGNQLVKDAEGVIQKWDRSSGASGLVDSIKNQFFNKETGKNILTAWVGDRAAESVVGQVVGRASGMAINPWKAVLYNSPDFRTFQFTYKLIPSNQQEADTLRAIAKEFKLGMHPTFVDNMNDNIFKYPDVWHISIPNDDYLFKFATCVLTSANFDFHAEGTKSYIRGEKQIPMAVSMSLSFQEVTILTKEDIDRGY